MPYLGISKRRDVGNHVVSGYLNVQRDGGGGCFASLTSDDGRLPFASVVVDEDEGVVIHSRGGWDEVEAFVAFFRAAADLIEQAAKERRAALARSSTE